MNFVYPQFLWAFLLLLLPIIIHLFNFRRQKVVLFSDIKLLKVVNESKKSGVKLRDWLLLLLRLLAFSALILAFSQPFVPSIEGGSSTSEHQFSVYIDNSLSAQSIGKNGLLLDEALSEITKWAQQYDAQDRFHLITNDVKGYQQRWVSRNEFLDFVGQVTPSAITKELREMVSAQNELVNESKSPSSVVIVSDFQKNTADIERLDIKKENQYLLYPLQNETKANLFIDTISFESPVFRAGSNLTLRFRVSNTGDRDVENLPVELYINNQNKGIVNISVIGGTSQEAEISFTVNKSGIQQGRLTIDDAEVVFDDDFYFTFETRKKVNILEVNPYVNDRKLEKLFSLDPLYDFARSSPENIQQAVVNGMDLIILNRLSAIPSGLASVLVNFVKTGGALAVIPGEEIKPSSYSRLLRQLNGPQLGSLTNSSKLESLDFKHSFFNSVFEKIQNRIALPEMKKSYNISTAGSLLTNPLITFSNGSPFLISGTYGSGSYYLQASGNEPFFGNWQISALFTTTFLRMAELSTFQNDLYQIFGENVLLSLPFEKTQVPESVELHKNKQEFIKLPVTKKQQQYQVVMDGTEVINFLNESGFYSILNGQDSVLLQTAFNYNRKESELEQYSIEELKSTIEQQGWKNVSVFDASDEDSFAENTYASPTEYWRILLILTLVFFAGEMLVNKLWNV